MKQNWITMSFMITTAILFIIVLIVLKDLSNIVKTNSQNIDVIAEQLFKHGIFQR